MLKLCNGCGKAFRPELMKRGRCRSCQIRNYNEQHKRMRREAIARQPFCVDCGTSEDLCADHRVPTSMGGLNVLSNYTVRCRSCNSRRRNEEAVF
jgi:hypothetical protein